MRHAYAAQARTARRQTRDWPQRAPLHRLAVHSPRAYRWTSGINYNCHSVPPTRSSASSTRPSSNRRTGAPPLPRRSDKRKPRCVCLAKRCHAALARCPSFIGWKSSRACGGIRRSRRSCDRKANRRSWSLESSDRFQLPRADLFHQDIRRLPFLPLRVGGP